MPPNSPSYRMADRLTGGKLAELLREQRATEKSYRSIARHLLTEYGVEATDPTIKSWCDALDKDEAVAS